MSAGTLTSRILGLIRESVIVAYFPKEVVDVFQTAFLIPNTFRRLTAEGTFAMAVVAVFSKLWVKRDLEASRRFVRAVLGFAVAFLIVLTVAGIYGAESLTYMATWGSVGLREKFALTVDLTRWMFPYVLLISLAALAAGLLNSTGHFFAPAFTPVFLNVCIIGSAVGLTGSLVSRGVHPIYSLVLGVLVGGVSQLLFPLPWLAKVRLLVLPNIDLRHPGLRRVLRLTGPMVFGAAAYQVGIILSNSLAWTLPHGSVMYVQSANRLMELPLAVLVIAISVASLPRLSSLRGQGELEKMKETYRNSLRLALFVVTPAMVGLVVLAEPLIAVLYQRGLFTYNETVKTAAGLRWLALGTCSVALVRQTVPMFYALEQVLLPTMMTLLFIAAHLGFGFVLKGAFLHEGLCMALSIAVTLQGMGLVIALRFRLGAVGFAETTVFWLRCLLASSPMGAAVYGVSLLGVWHEGGNSPRNLIVAAGSVVAGIAVYFFAARLFGIPECEELLAALKKRKKRS